MATLNRTFSVKNGIDVANTIIVDSNRNLSNVVTANATTINASTYLTVAGLNLVDHTNNAYNQANSAYSTANVANATANLAYAQANSNYQPAVTRLDVTNSGASAYRFDQYGAAVNNPTLYVRAGESLAFSLNVTGHPFVIRVSSGGANTETGLTHVSTAGVVTTGSAAQGKVTGTLYWKVPYELQGNTYVYQCTAHGGMVGNIVIEPPSTFAYAQANGAYAQANGAYAQANGAYAQANGAYAQANGAYAQANLAFAQANGAYAQANGAYAQANAAANLVAIYTNDSLLIANANVNFNNSASINVSGSVSGSSAQRGNIEFSLNTASITSVGRPTAALTLASNVTVDKDMTVTGNLFVLGNTTTVETSTLSVEDSLIKLALNNTSDAVDIGFFGVYDTTKQAGLFRDASDSGKFKLFTDYTGDLTANVITGAFNNATLVANLEAELINVTTISATTANVSGNLNVTGTTTYSNTVQFNNPVTINTALTVLGTSALNGAVTITSGGVGLTVANANVTFSLQVGSLNVTTNTVTTSSSGQVVLDKFAATQLASTKYFVQANSSTNYHTTEIVLVQDATNVYITEYGTIQTGPSLGSFSADISSGDVRLLFNATNNINTIRSVRYGILP